MLHSKSRGRRKLPEWMGETHPSRIASKCPRSYEVDDDCAEKSQATSTSKNAGGMSSSTFNSSDMPKSPSSECLDKTTESIKSSNESKFESSKSVKRNKRARKVGIGFLDKSADPWKIVDSKSNDILPADEIIAQSMPELEFQGSVIYSYNSNDCSCLCEEILDSLAPNQTEELHVGFDMEWPVTYQRGYGSGKVALVQLCITEEKCYLFHISAMSSFPKTLKVLLQNKQLKKIGINIESDFWKLEKDFDDIWAKPMIKNSMVDLGKMANKVLKSSENWSLEGLSRNVLKHRMNKDESVRCGNWNNYPLSEDQKKYAATDAFACLKIFNCLVKSS